MEEEKPAPSRTQKQQKRLYETFCQARWLLPGETLHKFIYSPSFDCSIIYELNFFHLRLTQILTITHFEAFSDEIQSREV